MCRKKKIYIKDIVLVLQNLLRMSASTKTHLVVAMICALDRWFKFGGLSQPSDSFSERARRPTPIWHGASGSIPCLLKPDTSCLAGPTQEYSGGGFTPLEWVQAEVHFVYVSVMPIPEWAQEAVARAEPVFVMLSARAEPVLAMVFAMAEPVFALAKQLFAWILEAFECIQVLLFIVNLLMSYHRRVTRSATRGQVDAAVQVDADIFVCDVCGRAWSENDLIVDQDAVFCRWCDRSIQSN